MKNSSISIAVASAQKVENIAEGVKKEHKFFLEVFGCQMNMYEGQLIEQMLTSCQTCQKGETYRRVSNPVEADILLFHTCAIREKAFQTISRRIIALQYLQRQKDRPIFGILGCLAQSMKYKIWELGLPVDLIVGPDNYKALPKLLKGLQQAFQEKKNKREILTKLSRNENYDDLKPMLQEKDLSAFVTIMRGCDNFCSFCIVPYTRGRERSRSPQKIIDEINFLSDTYHIKEVTLLGQNVNSYLHDEGNFTDLLEAVLVQTSIPWIRFTSPHPKDYADSLLNLMSTEERICSQIHLPLQSGSTRILKKMNRNYSQKEFSNLVEKIRDQIPNVGLSTDVIVGFCGETEDDFSDTLEVMHQAEFDMAFMYRYSDREHTLAHRKFTDDVSEKVKLGRLSRLIDTQQEISRKNNARKIGRKLKVLIEGDSRRSSQDWQSKSTCGKKIIFPKFAHEPQLSIRKCAEKNNPSSNNGHSISMNREPASTITVQDKKGRVAQLSDEHQKNLKKGEFAKVRLVASTAASFRGKFIGLPELSEE